MNFRALPSNPYQDYPRENCQQPQRRARATWALAAVLLCSTAARAAPPEQAAAPGRKAPKGPTGALVIVGGGVLPETIRDRFLELGGGEKARLVVIPTATRKVDAGLETIGSYTYWGSLAKARKVASVSFLHTRKRDEANTPAFVKPITEASAVWFPGGDQSLLVEAYHGTAVEREVRNVLARGGVVGGTSAGAAVMSELMIRSGNPVAEVGNGFGLLSGLVVDQHFNERNRLPRLLGVLAKYPQFLGLGIDEQTGVIVHEQSITVLGNKNVRVCYPAEDPQKAEVKVFGSGSRIDLNELNRSVKRSVNVAPVKMD